VTVTQYMSVYFLNASCRRYLVKASHPATLDMFNHTCEELMLHVLEKKRAILNY